MVHTSNRRIYEVEAKESQVQGHCWLNSEFEASIGYIRTCFENKIKMWPRSSRLECTQFAMMLVLEVWVLDKTLL